MTALEQRLYSHSGCAVIVLQDGEALAAGVKRLGLFDASGHIVVRQILDATDWCALAAVQQRELLARGTP